VIAILGFSFPNIAHSKIVQSEKTKTMPFVSSDIALAQHLPNWKSKRKEGVGSDMGND
jgi:hypothetical protein